MTGIIVARQWDTIPIVNMPIIISSIIPISTVSIIVIPTIAIPSPCLRLVGHTSLKLDHPDLRRTGTASPGATSPTGLGNFRKLPPPPPGGTPAPSPNRDFLLNSWRVTTQALSQEACFVKT